MSRTETDLLAILNRGDRDACIEFFRGMTEKERRTFKQVSLNYATELWNDWVPGKVNRWGHPDTRPDGWEQRLATARAAACASANRKELEKADIWLSWGKEWDVIEERQPPWLPDWVNAQLAQGPTNLHGLIDAVQRGIIPRPEHENYVLGHIPVWGYENRQISVANHLHGNPEFCQHDLWRLFELDGVSDCSLASNDKYSGPESKWSLGLIELSEDGTISRERLLDASLEALDRDFIQFRASWFSRFHEQLKPTLEERHARVDRYLQLLGSAIPPTVSFALHALLTLDKKNLVPTSSLLSALEPALHARSKAAINRALRLLKSAFKRSPDHRDQIASLSGKALLHETADVQERAFALLESLDVDPMVVSELLHQAADSITPSLKSRLSQWLGDEPSARECDQPAHKPLNPSPVQPIADLDEFLLAFAAVLEDASDPILVERVLDGLSRFSCQSADCGALTKRATKRLGNYGEDPIQFAMLHLALLWGGVETRDEIENILSRRSTGITAQLFYQRLLELTPNSGQFHGMLSLPTDTRGWIAPRTLVQRALAQSPRSEADQVLALLRLGTQHRSRALDQASSMNGEFGQALRFALGDDTVPIGTTKSLWLAAARARDPRGDAHEIDVAFPGSGPGGALASQHAVVKNYYEKLDFSYYTLEPSIPVPVTIPPTQPVIAFHSELSATMSRVFVAGSSPSHVRWSATIAPGCTEDYFAPAIMLINVDWLEAQWGARHFFEPMLYADVTLGPNAYRLLALGLAASEPGQWGMAVDCFVTAIGDERLDADGLGTAFAEFLTTNTITAGRWARSLGEAARVSKECASAARRTIESALRGDPKLAPRDLGKLLDTFHELCIEDKARITIPATRSFLKAITVGGKTGSLKKKLLAL